MNGQPPRLLTIEDDGPVRQGMVAFLEDAGYQVLEAETGTEGLVLFHRERPDAVICDLRLPGMDGLDVLTLIAKKAPETPVIVVSGAGVVSDVVRALQNGAWDYLTKPIYDMGLLDKAVTRVLERARLVRENLDYQRQLESISWRLHRSLEQLRRDEEAGRKIQLKLLPEDDRRIGPYRFQRRQYPSMYLCGDFVDYFPIDDRHVGFYMMDVSGHGAASAFVTVMLKTLIRTYHDALWQEGDTSIREPERVLQRLNQDLVRQELDKYSTLFYGVLDQIGNRMIYSNAGQFPHPVLVDGCVSRLLAERGRPIGLFEDAHYRRYELELPAQFGLLLVSDGLLELMPLDSARTRMQTFLNRLQPELDLEALIRGFQVRLGEPLPDDLSILLVTRDAEHG